MQLKKKELVVGTIVIFGLGFLIHFLYDWFPVYLVSIIAPVNESVWEHMKLFFTGVLGFILLDVLTKPGDYHNYLFARVLSIITMIVVFLVTWYPLYLAMGENFFITMVFFFFAILVGQFVAYRIRTEIKGDYSTISYIMLFLLLYLFISWTYNPPHLDLFIDPTTGKYGK